MMSGTSLIYIALYIVYVMFVQLYEGLIHIVTLVFNLCSSPISWCSEGRGFFFHMVLFCHLSLLTVTTFIHHITFGQDVLIGNLFTVYTKTIIGG